MLLEITIYIDFFQYSIILNLPIQHIYQHGPSQLLAKGYRIFHMECCHSSLTVLEADLEAHTLGSATEQVSLQCIFIFHFYIHAMPAI